MWDVTKSYARISLAGLTLPVRLGVFDAEKTAPQPVEIEVDLYRYQEAFPETGTLDDCMNYDAIKNYLETNWPARPHTELLETLAEDLIAFCFEDRTIEACRIRLRKPAIYDGKVIPELEVYRLRS